MGGGKLVEEQKFKRALVPKKPSVRLHTYAAGFGEDFASDLVSTHLEAGQVLLDPWVGSAVGPIQARMQGANGIAIDVDPIACLIAAVALTPYSENELTTISMLIEQHIGLVETELSSMDGSGFSWSPGRRFSLNGFEAAIPDNDSIDFWFAPSQRAVLAVLVEIAESFDDPRHKRVVQLAISSAIIRKWPSTISLAKDIDHSRPHRILRDDVTIESQMKVFRRVIRSTVNRLATINAPEPSRDTSWEILEGNTIDCLQPIQADSIDYILTSPPYFNAIDYPRAHKFAQWWLWPDSKPLDKSKYLGLMPGGTERDIVSKCYGILTKYRVHIDALLSVSSSMHRRLCKYLIELDEVVASFPRLLKSGANVTFVIGNNIIGGHRVPMSEILAAMLARHGFADIQIDSRRIRGDRRRYPYGITGFKGPMDSEFVVSAHMS